MSPDLLKVDLNVVPASECNGSYPDPGIYSLSRGIDGDGMMCAGGRPDGGKDTCEVRTRRDVVQVPGDIGFIGDFVFIFSDRRRRPRPNTGPVVRVHALANRRNVVRKTLRPKEFAERFYEGVQLCRVDRTHRLAENQTVITVCSFYRTPVVTHI